MLGMMTKAAPKKDEAAELRAEIAKIDAALEASAATAHPIWDAHRALCVESFARRNELETEIARLQTYRAVRPDVVARQAALGPEILALQSKIKNMQDFIPDNRVRIANLEKEMAGKPRSSDWNQWHRQSGEKLAGWKTRLAEQEAELAQSQARYEQLRRDQNVA